MVYEYEESLWMERQGREQEQYQPKSRPTNIRLKDKRQVMPEAKFITTTASIKLSKMREKYRIIPGGTSAGKTFNIIPIIYSRALLMPNKVFSITSETMPHLRKGAMRDFKNILRMTGRWDRSKWHGTDRSEEQTSELKSRGQLVCTLLL